MARRGIAHPEKAGASYAIQWQAAEDELARLLGLTLVRPLPAVVTTGSVLEVTQLLDQPHATAWKGVYVDADLRTVEIVGATAMDDGTDTGTLFMRLSSLQGAFLEGRTLEERFQVDSVGTPQLMASCGTASCGTFYEIMPCRSANLSLRIGKSVKSPRWPVWPATACE